MRLHCPDIDMHRAFLHNYPQHHAIDQQSLADFLTAIVLYGKILLESSSTVYGVSASWAEQLRQLLPPEVGVLVTTVTLSGQSAVGDQESREKAYDIMCSPLKEKIVLQPGEKIPNVYHSKNYVYHSAFETLNRDNGNRLNDHELAQAMYLHRGLFLQARAHESNSVYLPYHYRGRMLAHLPPLIWAQAPDDGLCSARLPLAKGQRPQETDYSKQLNEFYYSLLETISWKTYAGDIPFIGAAVLAKARGDPRIAFEIALGLRSDGGLRARFSELHDAAQRHDRPRFEMIFESYKRELNQAASHLGAKLEDPMHKSFYRLVTAFLPKSLEAAIEASVRLLPDWAKHSARTAASKLLTKSALQLLFIDHVRSVRRT